MKVRWGGIALRVPRVAAVLALLLVAAAGPPGGAAPNTLEPRLVRVITSESSGAKQPFEAFDTDKLNVFDLNGDGVLEIISQNDNNRLYVVDAAAGRVVGEVRLQVPPGWWIRDVGGVAIGDVDGDGRPNLVSANSAGFVAVYEIVPEKSYPDRYEIVKVWSKRMTPDQVNASFYDGRSKKDQPGYDSAPVLADVDGDGTLEIFALSDNVEGHYAFRHDGTILWATTNGDGDTNPWITDLEGDGKLEAVYVSDNGRVYAYNARDGKLRWTVNARSHGALPGSISTAPLIVDADGDGKKEIYFGARQARESGEPQWWMSQHAKLFRVDWNGKVRWVKSFDWGNPHMTAHLVPVDVDGDGKQEILGIDWNTIGHKPGNWQSTGAPNLFLLDAATGEPRWNVETSTFYSNKDPLILDVDGDGVLEILVSEGTRYDGFAVYSLDGKKRGWFTTGEWKVSNDAVAADLFGTGTTQLVVTVAKSAPEKAYRAADVGYRMGAIKIFDFEVPHRALYDGNILFNHELDRHFGGKLVGAATETRKLFQATVSGPASFANATWMEVRVNATEKLSGVEYREEGGSWRPLVAGPNGSWVDGARLPKPGAALDFVFRFDDGMKFAGARLAWGAGELKAPPPPPPPATPAKVSPPPTRPSSPSGDDPEESGGLDVPTLGLVGAAAAVAGAVGRELHRRRKGR